MTVRVSGGDLCEAEAPTEAAAETKDASKMSAQFVERDLFSGSLVPLQDRIGTYKDHRCETSDKMQAFTLLIRLSQKNT